METVAERSRKIWNKFNQSTLFSSDIQKFLKSTPYKNKISILDQKGTAHPVCEIKKKKPKVIINFDSSNNSESSSFYPSSHDDSDVEDLEIITLMDEVASRVDCLSDQVLQIHS